MFALRPYRPIYGVNLRPRYGGTTSKLEIHLTFPYIYVVDRDSRCPSGVATMPPTKKDGEKNFFVVGPSRWRDREEARHIFLKPLN